MARRMLDERLDAWALIERARLAFFLDDDLISTKSLASAAYNQQGATSGQRALADLILKCAAASSGQSVDSIADIRCLASIKASMISEVIYYAAYVAYFTGDMKAAEYWIGLHTPEEPEWSARYLVFQGLVAAAREDFIAQATFTAQALELLDAKTPDATYLISNAARMLAILSRDVACVNAVDRLRALLKRIGDDDGFTGSRFHVVRSLAWSHVLAGDYVEAMQFVHEALRDARGQIQHLYACLDHAAISVFANEQSSAAGKAAYESARRLVNLVHWESIVTDDLAALPLAAQVAAEFGASEDAMLYCDLAERGKGRIASRLTMAHDGRYDALVSEATALAYAGHDRRKSVEAAANAFETYKRIGFEWRAARMAILLYQTTHIDKWKARACSHLRAYPDAPFQRLLERPRGLTKRQEDVLRLVRLGYDDGRIASELGISYKTVRIHLGRLFRWYEVRSRSALMAKAAQASR